MMPSRNLPYLILEIANSHAGKRSIIEQLIKGFGKINHSSKGIKFQVFQPDRIATSDFKWYSVYQKLYFDSSAWSTLISTASEIGDVWIDVFDIYSVEVLGNNLSRVKGIKLQASVLQNNEVRLSLQKINLRDKFLMLNVSGFCIDQIKVLIDFFSKISNKIIIQVGFQSYPTKIEDTALNKIQILKSEFADCDLCIADHADAETKFAQIVPAYGFLLGCNFIEKHFCVKRSTAEYDGYSALELDEFNDMCISLRDAHAALGNYFVSEAEKMYLSQSIQIPILRRQLAAGDLINGDDLIFRRTSKQGLNLEEILLAQNNRHILKESKKQGSTITIADFKEARVAVIVAGRMKSSRLREKATLPICGIPSVERCLLQCLSVCNIHKVILATSTIAEDAVLKEHTLGGSVTFWQGDPDDVISRYLGACDKFDIDVVVRVTADCPLVFPDIIEVLLQSHFESGSDYTSAENCAVGSSGEVINVSALRRVINYFGVAKYSEYMTWYFKNNPDYFKLNFVALPGKWVRNYRLTLDYEEDLEMFNQLYAGLGGAPRAYMADEVIGYLDAHTEISEVNNHLKLKYKTDFELINTLNRTTKIE